MPDLFQHLNLVRGLEATHSVETAAIWLNETALTAVANYSITASPTALHPTKDTDPITSQDIIHCHHSLGVSSQLTSSCSRSRKCLEATTRSNSRIAMSRFRATLIGQPSLSPLTRHKTTSAELNQRPWLSSAPFSSTAAYLVRLMMLLQNWVNQYEDRGLRLCATKLYTGIIV